MTTEITSLEPKEMVLQGRKALAELTAIIRNRPDKVIINKKQYLEYPDWELLGVFFGITPRVVETQAHHGDRVKKHLNN